MLVEFIERTKSTKDMGGKSEAIWSDYSQRWFTLMPPTRPFIFRDVEEIAEHVRHFDFMLMLESHCSHKFSLLGFVIFQAAAPLESVRDITVASHLIGDLTGATIDDPLTDRYNKLGCKVSGLDKESDDYKMIVSYLEKTYEPVKVGEIVR